MAINKTTKKQRLIMHVDMDAFFASVEQLDHSEYRGKPVIVGGLMGRGVVSTCSYEARRFGVYSAMPMARAEQLCPHGIFVNGNYERYAEVSRQIFTVFNRFSPTIEPLSIDEAFLDISGMENLMRSPTEYAKRLKATILAETGLIASVGIAPNKFLAKIASDLDKPDGLVIITEDNLHTILDPLPVTRIWGVGKKMGDLLTKLNIKYVRDIRKTERLVLARNIGDKAAAHLKELAEGIDNRPVITKTEVKSIGKEITFIEDIQDKVSAETILLDLATQVGWRLRQKNLKGRTIALKLRTSSFITYTRQQTLNDPTCYDREIYDIACELLHKLAVYKNIRLLGISVTGFGCGEISLFNDEAKKEKLYAAIDGIKAKFGDKGIMNAKLLRNKDK